MHWCFCRDLENEINYRKRNYKNLLKKIIQSKGKKSSFVGGDVADRKFKTNFSKQKKKTLKLSTIM